MSPLPIDTARFTTVSDGLAHVLRDRPLVVPIYQRSYAWKKEQVEQFWADLRAAMSVPDPEYFMGTIVLTPGQDGRLTVIDGQQRMATTALLLVCFRNYLAKVRDVDRAGTIETNYLVYRDFESGEGQPRLVLNRDDQTMFTGLLLDRDPTVPQPQTESAARIGEAFSFLTEEVESEIESAGPNWTSRISQWLEFLENRVQVIVVRVNNDADAFLIFETLNDRGLALTIADLLKNYLFGLAGEDVIEDVESSWIRTVGAFDAPAEEEVVTTFLRHYWSSLRGATRERDLYRRIRSDIRSQQQAFDLAADLEIASTDYAALISSQHERWDEIGIPLAEVETLLRLGLEQNRPLLLAAMKQFEPEELRRLVRSVISWSVRGLVVGGIGGGTTERYYSDSAVQIRRGSATSTADVLELLTPIIPTDAAFQSAFSERRINNPRLSRYYLLALEKELTGQGDSSIVPSAIAEQYVLHRILPRRADPNIWWLFEPAEIGQWVFRLGNAVLMQEPLIMGDDFEEVKAQLARSGLTLTRQAAEYPSWTPHTIEDRQEKMAQVAVEVWPRVGVQ